jgi:hypothetical protein
MGEIPGGEFGDFKGVAIVKLDDHHDWFDGVD